MDALGQRRIASWQGLLILAGFSLVAIQWASPGVPGQGLQRVGLGVMYLLATALLGTSLGRRWGEEVFSAVCFLTAYWVLGQAALRPMSADSALILMVTAIAIGLVQPTREARTAFLLMIMGSVAVISMLVPPTGVSSAVVVVSVGIVTSVLLVQGYFADQTTAEIGELSLVASRVHNGVALLDTRGRIEWVNASFMKMAGETSQELKGRRLLDLLEGPEASADSVERLAQAVRAGHQASVELPHRSALGAVTWVSVDLTPVRDSRGHIQRFIAVETDISRARAFLARILDSMTDMLLVVQEGRGIRSANEAACHLLEHAEGELIGRPLEAFLDDEVDGAPAEGAARLRMLLTRRMTPAPGSAFGDLDLSLKSGSGGVVPVRASAAVLSDEPDQARLVVIVARDVRERLRLQDERTQLEEKIRQGQKLESLGVLAGGIAHDFNNLLVGILGNASLAGVVLEEDHDARPLVQRIERSAQRAADLTRQMLAYSGKGRFEIAKITLAELVSDLTELIDASISKKTELDLAFPDDLPPVEGDVTQLRQVVMNLLTNASESLGEAGGTVRVEGHRVQLTAADIAQLRVASESMRPGEYVCLTVADSGHGMEQETADRMFDPFFTTKSTGRGLGLAATLGIVRGHDGGLQVESQPGKGTRVRVYLPPSAATAVPVAADDEESGMWSGEGAILVADDEPEVLEFIETVLTARGFMVLTARDGQEAVETFAANAPRIGLVVLDMSMPRMSGEEALRGIRAINPEIRVILSSGYDEQQAIARYGDIAPAEFLQKPYRAAQLVEVVRSLVGQPEL